MSPKIIGAQWLSCRVLDLRLRGRRFEPHWCHCVVSLSKTHLSLLITGSTQEDLSWHNWKIVDWDVKNQINQSIKVGHNLVNLVGAYMWTLPESKGDSQKWVLKSRLKYTTFHQKRETPCQIWIKNFTILHLISNIVVFFTSVDSDKPVQPPFELRISQ